MSKKTRVRSAITGQFVKREEAARHPKTTVTETIKPTTAAKVGRTGSGGPKKEKK